MPAEIRHLGPGDEAAVLAAGKLFDAAPVEGATRRFLADPGHHLLIAYDAAGEPVGFVSGVEMTHPDKGTEMFLYELGVDEGSRRRGTGRALVEALAAEARRRGCTGMWTLTGAGDAPALATYARAGGTTGAPQLMPEWTFGAPGATGGRAPRPRPSAAAPPTGRASSR